MATIRPQHERFSAALAQILGAIDCLLESEPPAECPCLYAGSAEIRKLREVAQALEVYQDESRREALSDVEILELEIGQAIAKAEPALTLDVVLPPRTWEEAKTSLKEIARRPLVIIPARVADRMIADAAPLGEDD
jgi:hypothetical protein